ncbi:ACP S-malonyltransferase [Buchnera aphidicola]|uniref:ACP S-malonyltransferase n=1 Tax=Buchnera aphidicola TaxID=9 RepID=UPI0016515A97|nr:ACP S-malonyltransferase [Buchnera aphidicola]
MTLFAMLFPGQGSEYIGMLSSFSYNNYIIKHTFNEASDYIKFNLLKLVKEGPKEKLNQNQYKQSAILTTSVAIYRLWRNKYGKIPSLISGHSLGEYSALVCAKSIKFSDALKLVFLRGILMEKTSINRPVLMKAIIGLDQKKVEKACSIASKNGIVSIASINSLNQIVISGDAKAVCEASLYCKNIGAKNILRLNINVPAHCKIMKPVSKRLKKMLDRIPIYSPIIPIINNVDVKIEYSEKNIKTALIRQIYHSVKWNNIINLIQLKKIFIMLEVGPNKILTNLNKKNKNIISLHTDRLNNFLQAFNYINNQNE